MRRATLLSAVASAFITHSRKGVDAFLPPQPQQMMMAFLQRDAAHPPCHRSSSSCGASFCHKNSSRRCRSSEVMMASTSLAEQDAAASAKPAGKPRKTWAVMYPQLRRFYEEHDHSNPSNEDDPELSKWVQINLRNMYGWQVQGGDPLYPSGRKRSKLSEDKLSALADLDFQWQVAKSSTPTPVWDGMYPKLRSFYEKHGHSDPRDDEDADLSRWCDELRWRYRWQVDGGNPRFSSGALRLKLSNEKLSALDAIDFEWGERKRARTLTWKAMYPRLKAFYDEHGHSNPSHDEHPDLTEWMKRMRNTYEYQVNGGDAFFSSGKPRRRLSDEKLELLEDVEFDWGERQQKLTWDDMYPRLYLFYQAHGHSDPTDDPTLSRWVRNVRNQYRWQVRGGSAYFSSGRPKSRLKESKIVALEKVGFRWMKRMTV